MAGTRNTPAQKPAPPFAGRVVLPSASHTNDGSTTRVRPPDHELSPGQGAARGRATSAHQLDGPALLTPNPRGTVGLDYPVRSRSAASSSAS